MRVARNQAGTTNEEEFAWLSPASPIEKSIGEGRAYSWFVQLEAEDLAKIQIVTGDIGSVATIYAPDGAVQRRFSGDGAEIRDLYFVARQSGRHSIEIKASENAPSDRYKILLDRIVPLEKRLAAPTAIESEWIDDLCVGLSKDPNTALRRFWRSVEKNGAPIFESCGDPESVKCTFVYRGNEQTRNVLVSIPPYSRISRGKFMMSRVAGTDVWYATVLMPSRSRFLYNLVINFPNINIGPGSSREAIETSRAASIPDPLNPRVMPRADGMGADDARSIFEPPNAVPQLWLDRSPMSRMGTIERFTLPARELENERMVSVYTPHGYNGQSTPFPLLMFFDEQVYLREMNTTVTLDNLTDAGRIPPAVAVFVGNAPGARGRELACNPKFAAFVAEQLLDWVADHYNVARDPEKITLGGASLGGLAAMFTALHYPLRFGSVLSQSGSFWWNPLQRQRDSVEPNAVTALVLSKPHQKLRIYLEAGTDEIELPGRGMGILNANRNLRDVLRAKGYEVLYREYAGGHGAVNWRGGIVDGLIALLGDQSVAQGSR